MTMGRRGLLKLGASAVAAAIAPGPLTAFAAVAPVGRSRRIIDVHMHAYPATTVFTDPIINPITGAKSPIRHGAEHMEACIAEMKRHNVVKGIVSGGDGDRLKAATDWHDRDPARFVAGAGVRGSDDTPLPPLETLR